MLVVGFVKHFRSHVVGLKIKAFIAYRANPARELLVGVDLSRCTEIDDFEVGIVLLVLKDQILQLQVSIVLDR